MRGSERQKPEMRRSASNTAFMFDAGGAAALDVMGPAIQFITSPRAGEPCVMRGVIPPGAVIPVHSHPDPETFIQLSGEIEALVASNESFEWVKLEAGSVFHVPGNVRHAFRNRAAEPSVGIIATTARLGEFFAEIGRAVLPGAPAAPPSEETVRHFLDTARRYGHWTGTAEDNAAVSILLPKP
jgi:quercetin dioxygenase-like cupin family protein